MSNLPIHALRAQNGAATLLITVVILVLITLVSFYTSRSVLMEQKVTNADLRNKEAFEAAEAGLRRMLNYLREGVDQDGDGVADTLSFVLGNDARASVQLCDLDDDLSTCLSASVEDPESDSFPLAIMSIGRSADGSSERAVWQNLDLITPLPNVPNNPITTKGNVIIGGSATVHNPEGHSTVWSGSNVAMGSNQSTATEIANPNDPNYPTCMNDGSCSVTQSSNNNYVGTDVIEYDASLASLTDQGFFKNFFGMSKENYRQTLVTQDLATTDVGSTDGMTQEVIWVDGDASFSGGPSIGTADEPVVLVVDGNASFSGNTEIYGILMVLGDLNMTGNTTVHGAVVSNGNTSNTSGSLDVWYNSSVLANTQKNSQFTASPGSWRDFPGDV